MSSPDQNPIESVSRKSVLDNRYRAYVWAIVATTVVLIALLAWPFSVNEFRTSGRVRISIDPTVLKEETTDQIIAMAVVKNTTRERVNQLLRETRGTTSVQSPVLADDQLAKIRDAIQVGTRPGRKINEVEIQLTLDGKGTRDEVDFVNRLCNSVAIDISSLPKTRSFEQLVTEWTKTLSDQISQQNIALNDSTVILKSQLATAAAAQQSIAQKQSATAVAAEEEAIPTIKLQHEISRLYLQIQRDKANFGLADDDPRISQYYDQIDELKEQLNQAHKNGNIARIVNPFRNASTTVGSNLSGTNRTEYNPIDISSVDYESSISLIEQMQKQLTRGHQLKQQTIESFRTRLQLDAGRTDLIKIEQMDLARHSEPIGGTPNRGQFLLIAMVAFGLGGVVAWQFTPDMRIRKFRSAKHAESVLGLPVLGIIKTDGNGVGSSQTAKKHAVVMVIRFCEYAVLFLLSTLIIAMLVNSDIFGAMLNNPLQAISKFIWTIAPR